jgi:hypothetical protein
MMNGPEKSDLAIVAMKPANKAERSAAELVEPRAGTKGNAGQQSTHRTQSRVSVSQVLARIRQQCRQYSRWEPYAGKPHVRICAGARGNSRPYRERGVSSSGTRPPSRLQLRMSPHRHRLQPLPAAVAHRLHHRGGAFGKAYHHRVALVGPSCARFQTTVP